jgi:hypothetical protein
MKKMILGLSLILMATVAIACSDSGKDKVPKAVKDAFTKKFPTAKKVDWDKENDTEWEAEFKMSRMEYSANFLTDGTWKETEHVIDEELVPQDVMASLKLNFPGYKMEGAEISETKDNIVFEFEIEKGESEMEVGIDDKGRVVKKQVKDDDDEEGGEENEDNDNN